MLGEPGQRYSKDNTPPKDPNYRWLIIGEEVKVGDEFWTMGRGPWKIVENTIIWNGDYGLEIVDEYYWVVRRRIKTDELVI